MRLSRQPVCVPVVPLRHAQPQTARRRAGCRVAQVRDGFGPAGLAVCHADYRTSAGSQVVKENLQDMINSGEPPSGTASFLLSLLDVVAPYS